MNTFPTRRRLVLAAGAALGTAALPSTIIEALSAERSPTTASGLAAFDPAAFIADLEAVGCSITVCRNVPRGGERGSTPRYFIQPQEGREFGAGYRTVMARWADAMDACPDHVERVVACVFQRAIGAAA